MVLGVTSMSKYKADLHEFFVKLHDIKEIFSGSRLDARIFDKTNQEVGVIHPYNRSFQLKVGKYEYEAARNDVKEVFDSQYQPESPILILFGDSFHKIDGPGSADYQREHSILDQDLDSDTKYSQVHSRQYVLHCLKNGGLTWQNTDLKDSYFNQALTPGEDFGGDAAEPGVSYMPAIERYNGDFYVGLGEEESNDFSHRDITFSYSPGCMVLSVLLSRCRCTTASSTSTTRTSIPGNWMAA